MQLTPYQLELVRTRPQETNENLFVFQPRAVLKCRVNNPSIAKGARTIAYNTVTFGSYLNVIAGMTVLIGTSDGASDVGRIRLRALTPSQMVVSENSDIKWEDQLYITILRYWEIWPVFPRIIQNPSNATDVIFYKDYDIAHTNQNNILGTFIQAGPHQGVLLEGGTGTVHYSASGSFNLLGNSLSYDWEFEGGNPSGSVLATPGNIYYTAPGDYVTTLTVTASNGAVDKSYKYVSVKNKIGEGSTTPIVKWQRGELRGSRGEAGASVEITIFESVELMENSLVIITADDWFGNTHTNLGGNQVSSSIIFFVGYVERDSIRYNATRSSVTFAASSPTFIMKKATGFSLSVESSQSAVKWFQLKDMDIRRAIYHFLRWHSTVLNVADFEFRGTDRKIQYFDADRGSLFDAIDNLLRGALIGSLCSDRQGKLWGEVEPRAYDDPTGTFTPVMEITRRDWMEEPNVEERIYDDSSYTELGGIAYSGAVTGTWKALLADAPGGTPGHMGNVDVGSGLALESQTQLNKLVGHIWANKNTKYPTVSMVSPVMLKNLDVAPYEVVRIHITPEDTTRNVDIDGLYIPTSMSWSSDTKNRMTLPSLDFTQLVNGNPGDTIIIPPINEIEYPDMNFNFPPFPDFLDIPALVIYDPTVIQNVLVSIKDQGIFFTEDFDSEYPTWYPMNVNLPDFNIVTFEVGTTGKVFLQHGTDSLWMAPYPGGAWEMFFTTAYDPAYGYPFGGTTADPNSIFYGGPGAFSRYPEINGFALDRNAEDSLLITGNYEASIGHDSVWFAWIGSSNSRTRDEIDLNIISYTPGYRYAFITKTSSGWLITFYGTSGQPISAIISSGGTTISDYIDLESGSTLLHTQSIHASNVAVNQYKPNITNDGGNSWVPITGSPTRYGQANPDEFQSVITNDNGTQIIVGTSNVLIPPGLVYSINGGTSWVTGTFITGTFNATSVWHLQDSGFIIGGNDPNTVGSTKILAVYDISSGTVSAFDKTGNLQDYITGSMYPTAIRHFYNYE